MSFFLLFFFFLSLITDDVDVDNGDVGDGDERHNIDDVAATYVSKR